MISLYEYATDWYLKKLQAAKRVLYAQVHLTERCQYHCGHCYYAELGKKAIDMDFDAFRSRIKELTHLARSQGRFLRVDFTGGDPLLSPVLPDAVQECEANGVVCGLKCNPDILACGDAQSLATVLNGCSSVSLSLDGTKAFHDSLRHRKGSSDLVVKALRKANELGLKTRVNMTISRDNKDMIRDVFADLVKENVTVDAFTFARFWNGSFCDSMLSREDLVDCFDSCCSFYESYLSDPMSYGCYDGLRKPKVQLAFKEHLWLPYLESKGLVDKGLIGYARRIVDSLNCSALHQTVVIDPDNELFHCRKVSLAKVNNLTPGNLGGERFRSYVDSQYMCRSCVNEGICFGCPAVDEIVEKSDSGNPCPFYSRLK